MNRQQKLTLALYVNFGIFGVAQRALLAASPTGNLWLDTFISTFSVAFMSLTFYLVSELKDEMRENSLTDRR